jgi:type III secretion protein J
LSEVDANQIVLALDRAAIAATKSKASGAADSRYEVDVAATDGVRALRVLEAQRLPQRAQPGVEALYDDRGLLTTPSEERARAAAATAGELARSLERMPGVRTARVHLALTEPATTLDPGADEHALSRTRASKAAVLIQRRLGAAAIPEQPMRDLIAAAVTDLDPNQITIVQVTPDAQEPSVARWARVGPFTVARDSAPGLRAVLAAALALDLVMAFGLVALVRRWRHATRELARSRPSHDR